MVKHFCDKCGKEIIVTNRFEYKFKTYDVTYDVTGMCGHESARKYIEVCDECLNKMIENIEEKKDD